jgi:hypothetical protein
MSEQREIKCTTWHSQQRREAKQRLTLQCDLVLGKGKVGTYETTKSKDGWWPPLSAESVLLWQRTCAKWSCYPPGRRYWQNAHMLHGIHAVQHAACCCRSLECLCSTVATRVLLHDNITPCTIA